MQKRLYKVEEGKIIDGVCWIIFACGVGSGIIAYIICMIIMPRKSDVIKGPKRVN